MKVESTVIKWLCMVGVKYHPNIYIYIFKWKEGGGEGRGNNTCYGVYILNSSGNLHVDRAGLTSG